MTGSICALRQGMAERYRIRRLSADDIQDAKAKRRAAINAERIKLGLSRKEAASALPGAAFLAQGKRARSQQTGERAKFFKAQRFRFRFYYPTLTAPLRISPSSDDSTAS